MTKQIGKILQIALALAAMTSLLFLLCPVALADDAGAADAVLVDENGVVTLTSDHMAEERVSSIQVKLRVEGEGTPTFTFSGGLSGRLLHSSVKTEQDATVLNIYIAGADPLMGAGETQLVLGTVTGAVVAPAAEDALQFVYGMRTVAQTVDTTSVRSPNEGGGDDAEPSPAPDTEPSPVPGTEVTPAPDTDSHGGFGGYAPDPTAEVRESLRTALNSANEAYGTAEIAALYTQQSWQALQTAIGNANAMLNDYSASREDVEGALSQLQAAIDGLVRLGRSALVDTLEKAKAYEAAGYTENSFAVLQEAIRGAESVLMDDGAAESEWSAALAELEKAIDKLVPYAGADGNGPVISDGADDGTGGGAPEAQGDDGTDSGDSSVPAPRTDGGSGPSAATAPATGNAGGTSPKTGDETVILPWIALLLLTGCALMVLIRRRGRCK